MLQAAILYNGANIAYKIADKKPFDLFFKKSSREKKGLMIKRGQPPPLACSNRLTGRKALKPDVGEQIKKKREREREYCVVLLMKVNPWTQIIHSLRYM